MADADEDVIRTPATAITSSTAGGGDTSDAEDEAQDYPTFTTSNALPFDPTTLDALLDSDEPITRDAIRPAAATAPNSAIPRRGDKDFEPHATDAQAQLLKTSRDAMHTALSHARTHGPKTRVLGVFDPLTKRVVVRRRRGVWLNTTGQDLPGGGVELLPEETLWALEGGRLDLRYRDVEAENQGSSDEEADIAEESLLPVSLQGAYAAFLAGDDAPVGGSGLTMEKYVVYAGLKRAGFIVTRAEGFSGLKTVRDEAFAGPEEDAAAPATPKATGNPFSWLYWILSGQRAEQAELERRKVGPLVKPGLYRSYQDIYRALHLIQAPKPLDPVDLPPPADKQLDVYNTTKTISTPYTTTWNIYQPSRPYKKRSPPIPAFRMCVISARDTQMPTPVELDDLLAEQPADTLQNPTRLDAEEKKKRNLGQTYAAIKRGRVSVLLAVVDEGLVSYLRVSEASFATEGRIFERVIGQNERGKGSGRGRGRGRGRGKG